MQHSIQGLREAAEQYEKHAAQERWDELLVARADVTELLSIADAEKPTKGNNKLTSALSKFCPVALEYSKLLDVVMNQSPEYAALAWGAIKLLLVAKVNHERVKENVEKTLIAIGERLGLVNQLTYYNPTEEMAKAVGMLYADFSKFLSKAIKLYTKSKLSGSQIY